MDIKVLILVHNDSGTCLLLPLRLCKHFHHVNLVFLPQRHLHYPAIWYTSKEIRGSINNKKGRVFTVLLVLYFSQHVHKICVILRSSIILRIPCHHNYPPISTLTPYIVKSTTSQKGSWGIKKQEVHQDLCNSTHHDHHLHLPSNAQLMKKIDKQIIVIWLSSWILMKWGNTRLTPIHSALAISVYATSFWHTRSSFIKITCRCFPIGSIFPIFSVRSRGSGIPPSTAIYYPIEMNLLGTHNESTSDVCCRALRNYKLLNVIKNSDVRWIIAYSRGERPVAIGTIGVVLSNGTERDLSCK